MNKRGFIFEDIRLWFVTNLATLIHGYSYLILLKTVVGYRKLTTFKETQISPGIKPLYDRGKKLIHVLADEA